MAVGRTESTSRDRMRYTRMSTPRANLAALILLLAIPLERAAGVTFERPDSLQPAIGFWTRVYGEIDSLSGFVHDSDSLSVVYETLRFNWYDSAQMQERRIEEAVANYQSALHSLAGGKRKDLSPREQKVLTLWGDDASAETLAAAANRIRFQRGQADRIREGIMRAHGNSVYASGCVLPVYRRDSRSFRMSNLPTMHRSSRTREPSVCGNSRVLPGATICASMRSSTSAPTRLDQPMAQYVC